MHINAEGTGATQDAAVSGALASAIQQATGVAIDVAQFSDLQATSLMTESTHETTIVQAAQDTIRKTAGGFVRSYRITSVEATPNGSFTAEVSVDVEVFRAKGLGNETRRRIAVAMFATPGNRPGPTADLLRDRIAAHLTQSRRFAS
jgi:hypothetical protein